MTTSHDSDPIPLLVIGQRLFALTGDIEIVENDHRTQLLLTETLQPAFDTTAAISIERHDGIDTGSILFGGRTYRLASDLQAATMVVPANDGPQEASGATGLWWTGSEGRFVEDVDIFISAARADVAQAVLRAFMRPAADAPDAVFPWTLDSATRYVAKKLFECGHATASEILAPGSIILQRPTGPEQIDLTNVWPDVRDAATPSDGRRGLDQFVRGITAPPALPRRASVVARVEFGSAATIRFVENGLEQTQGLASQSIGDDLQIIYALDGPESVQLLSEEEARALEPDDDKRVELVRGNLRRLVPRVHIKRGTVMMVCCDGTYEASLILLPEFWEYAQRMVEGELRVAVLARDLLLFTGEEYEASLRDFVASVDEPAYGISDGIYRRRADGWLTRV